MAPPEDPTGRDDSGGDKRFEGPRHPKSDGASPGQNPTVATDLSGAVSQNNGWSLPITTNSRRSLSTADGRTLSGSSGRSLPAPDPATPISQAAVSTSTSLPAAGGVTQIRIGTCNTVVPTLTAWALAAGGTWRRLVADLISGTVVDIGRTRYRPPAGLANLVRARDRACVFSACQTPAERCDINHLIAWSQGGTIGLNNLTILCQVYHRLEYTLGWILIRNQTTGALSWHTSNKIVYQRHPDGIIIRLPHRTGPHQRHTLATAILVDLSQQVSPDILNRPNRVLDIALDNHTHDHTGPGTNASGRARLEIRGPQPGHKPGAFEPAPYPKTTHTLQLAPLTDTIPSF